MRPSSGYLEGVFVMAATHRLLQGYHRSEHGGRRYGPGDVFAPTANEIRLLGRRIEPVRPPVRPKGSISPTPRPIRILGCVGTLVRGGGHLALAAVLRGLARRGFDIRLVAEQVRGIQPAEFDIPVQVVKPERQRSLYSWADVVMVQGPRAREVSRATRKPIIIYLHGPLAFTRYGLTPSNIVLVVTNAAWLRDGLDWSGDRLAVHPPIQMARYATTRGEHITLVNLARQKRPELLFVLARRLPDHKFLAVRGGWGRQLIPQAVPGNVTVIGPTAHMRDEVYARTRILLMPSPTESWGMVGVEAMASGIPVIAAPAPGSRESLGAAGVFLPPDDVGLWEQEIRRLDDPEYYAARSEAALARAQELDPEGEGEIDALAGSIRGLLSRRNPGAEYVTQGREVGEPMIMAMTTQSASWWESVHRLQTEPGCVLPPSGARISRDAKVEKSAIIRGPVHIGPGAKVDCYAIIEGPVYIGASATIGSYAKIRPGSYIGDNVLLGSYCEVKASLILDGAQIGPMCMIADSYVCARVFVAAVVRVASMMLEPDKRIRVRDAAGDLTEVDMAKLGCYIGKDARIGAMSLILPGRAVAAGAVVMPQTIFGG